MNFCRAPKGKHRVHRMNEDYAYCGDGLGDGKMEIEAENMQEAIAKYVAMGREATPCRACATAIEPAVFRCECGNVRLKSRRLCADCEADDEPIPEEEMRARKREARRLFGSLHGRPARKPLVAYRLIEEYRAHLTFFTPTIF